MLPEEKRIRTKAQLKDWLSVELRPYENLGPMQDLLNLFNANQGAILRRHMILLRTTEYHINAGHRLRALLWKRRLRRLQNRYELHVALNCCGRGLHIMHLGPILMNGHVTVGENCSFHFNTGLVAGGTDDGVPTLGDNVIVGFGAVVLGGVHIADGIAIGANAVVNKNFLEPNITIAGVPARKISDHGTECWNKGVRDRGDAPGSERL